MAEQNQGAPADLSCLNEYTDGDPEMVKELIGVFFETFDESLLHLKEHIKDGECAEWSETAHKLKGAAGYVGASVLREHCAKAQDMKVAALADRSALYEKICTSYDEVKVFLEAASA